MKVNSEEDVILATVAFDLYFILVRSIRLDRWIAD